MTIGLEDEREQKEWRIKWKRKNRKICKPEIKKKKWMKKEKTGRMSEARERGKECRKNFRKNKSQERKKWVNERTERKNEGKNDREK